MDAVTPYVHALRSGIDDVVFGNGWLAGGGILLVVAVAVAVRITGGVRV
ncbi:MAG: hypothetical protein ACRYF3_01280 [Janthinobacterium lividum]